MQIAHNIYNSHLHVIYTSDVFKKYGKPRKYFKNRYFQLHIGVAQYGFEFSNYINLFTDENQSNSELKPKSASNHDQAKVPSVHSLKENQLESKASHGIFNYTYA